MENNYPIFLPNVISTSTSSNNRLIDEKLRLFETRNAIFSLINGRYFNKIVIVDGSNIEILRADEIKKLNKLNYQIEQIKFQQDVEQVKLFGKSNGEMQITNYALKTSRLINENGGYYKLSPRYNIKNLEIILGKINKIENFFYFYNPPELIIKKPFICTAFYKISNKFYEKHLSESIFDCGLEVNGYLETVFYNKLIKLNKKSINVEFPYFSGLGGTLGVPIKNRYYNFRNIISKMGLLGYSY